MNLWHVGQPLALHCHSTHVKCRSEPLVTLPGTNPSNLLTLSACDSQDAVGGVLLIPISDLKNARKVTNDLSLPHRQVTDVELQPGAVLFCALNRLTSSNEMFIQNSRSEGRGAAETPEQLHTSPGLCHPVPTVKMPPK